MTVDRYTKLVLTVIAACLLWLSAGGPSLITPVRAQTADRVLLAGWVDATGNVLQFPRVPVNTYDSGFITRTESRPASYPLPMAEWYPR